MSKQGTQENLINLINEADEIFSNIRIRENSRSTYKNALNLARKENKHLEIEYILGKLELLDSNWNKALKHFEKSISIDSKHAKSWNYKGFTLNNLRRYKDALKSYNKALELNPNYVIAWNNKGVTLIRLREYEESLKYFEKALDLNSDYFKARANKALALSYLGKYDDALNSIDEAINRNGKIPSLLRTKGNIYYDKGLYETAINCYDESIELEPNYVNLYLDKSQSLIKLGNIGEALKCSEKSLEIDKNNLLAWQNYAIILSLNNKDKEALEALKCALKIDPYDKLNKRLKNLLDKILSSEEEKKKIDDSDLEVNEKEERSLELSVQKKVIKKLVDKQENILDIKSANEDKIRDLLKPRSEELKDNFLMVLRRWNSYTPTLNTDTEANLGGGYFLYWKGKGIIIDPGFDFLKNFFNNEFYVSDINAVIITHAHIDHCNDFESILTLIFEYNEGSNKKKIDVFMNMGVLKKMLGWLSIDKSNPNIKRIYPLEHSVSYLPEGYDLKITATKSFHNEIVADDYAVGVIFNLFGDGEYTEDNPFRIGYTSDTRCEKEVITQYKDVDLLIAHLGSFSDYDFGSSKKMDKNHLTLKGVISVIYESNANLVVISEFGEELGEHRLLVADALNQVFKKKRGTKCLTGDIGLKIRVPNLDIKCESCSFMARKDIYVDKNSILEVIDPEKSHEKKVIYHCDSDFCKGYYKEG